MNIELEPNLWNFHKPHGRVSNDFGYSTPKVQVQNQGASLQDPKSLEGRECPTVDIEIYNKRRKEIVAKQ